MSVVYLTWESGCQHLQPVSPVVKEMNWGQYIKINSKLLILLVSIAFGLCT